MTSASALKRNCGYVRLLQALPPRTAAEHQKEANKKAAAGRGTVFHEAVEAWAKTGTSVPVDDPEIQGWLDLLAFQWAPPPGFMAELAWGLTPEGGHCEVDEPEPHKYQRRGEGGLLTAGRTDGAWIVDDILWLVDWKTGTWPVETPTTNLQVSAACLALAQRFSCRAYIPAIYYTRDGVWDWGEEITRDSDEWRERMADVMTAALLGDTPRPGDHCGNCWERRRCQHAVGG
jgi:hypothetical protein